MRVKKSNCYYKNLIKIPLHLLIISTLLTTKLNSQVYNNLPASFPKIIINTNTHIVESGKYFMSGAYFSNPSQSFTMIMDTTGMPVYFQRQDSRVVDFDVQPNGLISYYKGALYNPQSNFVVVDSNFNTIYNCAAINGYITDPHELIILEDNSYWILGLDIRTYDMSQIVEGGNPDASVEGCVIQHISSNGDLLFQWNSWDYIPILDCDTRFVNLTSSTIDYIHANALDFDYDGNILLSSRHLNEITKIDVNTGEIIWRLGGKQNQFTISPDGDCFYGQHCIRYCEETNSYVLFDNGNWHDPEYSRGVEYSINVETMTATKIKQFSHNPSVYSSAQGGIQRIANHNTIVNWASNSLDLIFTEFDEQLNTIFEASCPDTSFVCYRVYKFDWTNTLFNIEDSVLEFTNVSIGDSVTKSITLNNNQNSPLIINGYNSTDSAFVLVTELPITIEPKSSVNMEIMFKPVESNKYNSLFSLFHSTDTSRIAQQINVNGTILTGTNLPTTINQMLSVFPNPASLATTISLPDCNFINNINIYDTRGNIVLSKNNINKHKIELKLNSLTSGLYIVSVFSEGNNYFNKLIVK